MTSIYSLKTKENWKPQYRQWERNGIWLRKMCHTCYEKWEKWHMSEGIELPNQEKIRTLREKEIYKYLEIFKADTIKQMEMKEKKLKKSISGEPENYSRQKYIPGTL